MTGSDKYSSVLRGAASCPLCQGTHIASFHQDARRDYWQCQGCELVFVPQAQHLSAIAEKAEYDKHQNHPDDPGYRAFLSRTLTPLVAQLSPGAEGLDFGCGPGPTLSRMAAELGYAMSDYDLYYFPEQSLLRRRYDFITLTEVIEHIADPAALLQQLDALLKPGGILALMTKRVQDQAAFARWHYKNDLTHICFYSLATFGWIAQQTGWRLQAVDKDVVFFYRDGD